MLAELNDCVKSYSTGFRKQTTVLDHVSWGIPQGALLGLVGPNGSGKSTSIKLILGLIKPTRGTASLFGGTPGRPEAFRRVGYIAENVSFSDTLKALEILDYYGRVHKLDGVRRKKRAAELLEEVGLTEHTAKTIRQFSKGMVQRLALACALMHDPELLILDEPMSGLDPIGRRFVIDLLARQHRSGKTICFSSHLLHDIEVLCDKLVIIYRGKLIYQGGQEGLSHRGEKYRLVFSLPTKPPEWVGTVTMQGPSRWVVYGSADKLVDLITPLRDAGARILEFSAEGSSLESSFFDLVEK
jgi:ABC-2 type transport system ATP-binding protein